ncbi:MAG: DUF1553 domain-containing protein [Planctomycetaceae bacterium]|nr:DUF1553 domain-containing protein [Planctomycetaceae bacterium]
MKSLVILLLAITPSVLCADEQDPWLQNFQNKVAPILQQHCFECHNTHDHKGDFSLQSYDEIQASGFIEAGDPENSRFIDVLKAAEMPKDKPALTKEQITVLETWITKGAPWPQDFKLKAPAISNKDWWSWRPLKVVPTPQVANPFFDTFPSRTPIDQFVIRKLVEKQLKPTVPADRRSLIRRLTYDLTGLPPTLAAINDFVADRDPLAYSKLVDRLLASPAYGEHWGRHWLDVVKYADTCGYDKDKLRPNAWPYRDYVIRSFNQDKPYSQFVQEQVAGDVLYPQTADGILGLGFIAAGPWDFIGHAEVAESKLDGQIARNIDRDEMVSNTLNTFVSTTIQCARCHNHKFDAITQRHYYNLQTVFAAVDKADRVYDADPQVEKTRQQLNSKLAAATAEVKQLEQEIKQAAGADHTAAVANRDKWQPAIQRAERPDAYGFHSSILDSPSKAQWVQVDLGESTTEITRIRLYPASDDYAGVGDGFGFPVRFQVAVSNDKSFNTNTVIFDHTQEDFPNPKLAYLEIPHREKSPIQYIRVTATKLAERSNDYIMVLSEIVALDQDDANSAHGMAVTASSSIEAPVRWARQNVTDGLWPRPVSDDGAQKWFAAAQQVQRLWSQANTAERKARQQKLHEQQITWRSELTAIPAGAMVYAAASHFKAQANFKPTNGSPREIHVLARGDIRNPLELANPGSIPVLSETGRFELADNHAEGDRRAALALWLTQRKQPLTWRSIVNRIWQHHFGKGIVNSPNDFGRMGRLPTHPELLDYLAQQFRDNGQSIKELQRLIVTSSVYRQGSKHDTKNHLIDNSNQYLWRMNRRRLSAEEIRDSILSATGLLNDTQGGPGFYLFKLEHPEHSPHYEYHKYDPTNPLSYRRAVYRFVVRSQPDPFMTILDCADSSQSTPVRDETITSVQALAFLNNKFNLAMAERFSESLQDEAADITSQVRTAFSRMTGRLPTSQEQAEFEQYARKHDLKNFCRILFNLNEFIYLD